MWLSNYNTALSDYDAAALLHYHTVVSLHYYITALLHCCMIKQIRNVITILLCNAIAELFYYIAVSIK